jgi:hypothetical protein
MPPSSSVVISSYVWSRGLSMGKWSTRLLELTTSASSGPSLTYYITPSILPPTILKKQAVAENSSAGSSSDKKDNIVKRDLNVIYTRAWDSATDGSLPSLSTLSESVKGSKDVANPLDMFLPGSAAHVTSLSECSISGLVIYATSEVAQAPGVATSPVAASPRSYHVVYLTPRSSNVSLPTWLPCIQEHCTPPSLPDSASSSASVYGYNLIRNKLGVSAGYKIYVRTANGSWTVVRRYSQIKRLCEEINESRSMALIKKDSRFSHMSSAVIKERIARMNEILAILLTSTPDNVAKCQEWLLPDEKVQASRGSSPKGKNRVKPTPARRQSIFQRLVAPMAGAGGSGGGENESDGWVVVEGNKTSKGGQLSSGNVPTEITLSFAVALISLLLKTVTPLSSFVNAVASGFVQALPEAARAAVTSPLALLAIGMLMGAGVQSVMETPTVMSRCLSAFSDDSSLSVSRKGRKASSVNRRRKSSILLSTHASSVSDSMGEEAEMEAGEEEEEEAGELGSPLPMWPDSAQNCYSVPPAEDFKVRGPTYMADRVKVKSQAAAFPCRGVDLWLTDDAMTDIKRHPSMLGGKLNDVPTLVINFMMPWGNLVSYYEIPKEIVPKSVATVWSKFVAGDQKYRDSKLKLLPVVVEGPWVCRKAIGGGNAPAVIGKALPVQYFDDSKGATGHFEVDLDVCASSVARGILSIVKNHTKNITIDLVWILEATGEAELPENVLGAFRLHSLDPDRCMLLPKFKESGDGELGGSKDGGAGGGSEPNLCD